MKSFSLLTTFGGGAAASFFCFFSGVFFLGVFFFVAAFFLLVPWDGPACEGGGWDVHAVSNPCVCLIIVDIAAYLDKLKNQKNEWISPNKPTPWFWCSSLVIVTLLRIFACFWQSGQKSHTSYTWPSSCWDCFLGSPLSFAPLVAQVVSLALVGTLWNPDQLQGIGIYLELAQLYLHM